MLLTEAYVIYSDRHKHFQFVHTANWRSARILFICASNVYWANNFFTLSFCISARKVPIARCFILKGVLSVLFLRSFSLTDHLLQRIVLQFQNWHDDVVPFVCSNGLYYVWCFFVLHVWSSTWIIKFVSGLFLVFATFLFFSSIAHFCQQFLDRLAAKILGKNNYI